MLANSKNVLFPGHNHLLTTDNNPSCAGALAIIKVSGHKYWWLAGSYDLRIGQFRSGYHGSYLVDSSFLRSVSESSILTSNSSSGEAFNHILLYSGTCTTSCNILINCLIGKQL